MQKFGDILGALTSFGLLAGFLTSLSSVALGQDDGFVTTKSGDLVWHAVAEFPGIDFALLEGNPSEAGIYVIRARFAPGVMSRPHFHSTDRLVTVISGIWFAGTDANFDKDKTIALYPGDFMKHPAGGIHYDGAKDVEAVVEISGIGPVITTGVTTTGVPIE